VVKDGDLEIPYYTGMMESMIGQRRVSRKISRNAVKTKTNAMSLDFPPLVRSGGFFAFMSFGAAEYCSSFFGVFFAPFLE